MGNVEKITIADIKPVTLTEQDKKKIEEKPKTSATAYEWYAKGLEVQATDPKKALTNFKKALDIDANYTDALIQAGWTSGNILNLFDEALGYFEKAEQIFKSRNETKSVSYAIYMRKIGNVYWQKGQLDRALEYYLRSQSISDNLGLQNTANYAILILNIASLYEKMGQSNMAGKYYRKSYDTFVRAGYSGELKDNVLNHAKRLGH